MRNALKIWGIISLLISSSVLAQEGETPNDNTTTENAGSTESDPNQTEAQDVSAYALRLRNLEQQINEVKEQIFQSKARLSMLAETVLQGVVSGSKAVIVHKNEMGSSYQLVRIVYSLDGAPIFNRSLEDGDLSLKEFQIYNGSIVPGEHTISVNLEYQGNGQGIFSYMKGYSFKVKSNFSFTAPENKTINLKVLGFERGGPTIPLDQRPAVRFKEAVTNTIREDEASESEMTPSSEEP